jgi:integrase
MTKTYDPDNERVKRAYLSYMRDAQQHSEASLDAIVSAIHRFESYTRFKPFKAFHREQAIAFKEHLGKHRSERSGTLISVATQYAVLAALKAFFRWLAGQPGFKKRLLGSDADYFSMSRSAARIAKARRETRIPSLEQMRQVIFHMPAATDIERRDRALMAFELLTGARDGAIPSLKRKHLDTIGRRVVFDAREVRTKFSKSFSTWFFPVGDDIAAIVSDWATYLDQEALWGSDDPLFPATRTEPGPDKEFQAMGLDRRPWRTANPVRKIFRTAFDRAGLPYCSPHSVRKTLARLGQQLCQTPEQYKAWSQNLGHEGVLTTFLSYGEVETTRQAEIIRALGRPNAGDDDPIQELIRAASRVAGRSSSPPA